jgi:hypothetical protein
MKHFTDRIFYLERTGLVVHISFLTSGNWVMHLLDDDGVWSVAHITETYEKLYQMIRRDDPTCLLQEEWD